MYFYSAPFFGMHFLWWIFWGAIWIAFFTFLIPVPRRKWQALRETPVAILQSRLAKGEIDQQEYERIKAVLERDKRQEPPRPRISNSPAAAQP